MKRSLLPFLILAAGLAANGRAETETIDLKALAKKARPSVMLLVVSDVAGKEIATGTGFLVSSDGKLITNHHVIENAASAVAKAENGGLFPVEGVLADDPKNDLVLLKLTGKDLPFLTLGNGDKIEVGTRIAVIGSPLGLEGTLSEGIVSAVREVGEGLQMLQITAAISPGSSGSPVLGRSGEVVGCAKAVLEKGQLLNFAVRVAEIRRLLRKLDAQAAILPLTAIGQTQKDAVMSSSDFRAYTDAVAKQDFSKALAHAQTLVRKFQSSSLARGILGFCYSKLGFRQDALIAFQDAVKLRKQRT